MEPADPEIPQRAKELLDSFRVEEKPPQEALLWFLVGAAAFALLYALVSWIVRRQQPPPVEIPAPSEKRRASLRVSTDLPASVRIDDPPASLPGQLLDLSTGGATVLVDRALPPRTPLRIVFSPNDEGPEQVSAEVVRSHPSRWSRQHYVHCRFTGLSQEQQLRLQHAVAALERRRVRLSGR